MRYLLVCFVIAGGISAVARSAQMQAEQTPSQGPQDMGAGQPQKGTHACGMDMQRMQQNRQVELRTEAARQSNDPERMRAALLEAEKALAAMDSRMNGCMGRMNTTQQSNEMPQPGRSGYLHE